MLVSIPGPAALSKSLPVSIGSISAPTNKEGEQRREQQKLVEDDIPDAYIRALSGTRNLPQSFYRRWSEHNIVVYLKIFRSFT